VGNDSVWLNKFLWKSRKYGKTHLAFNLMMILYAALVLLITTNASAQSQETPVYLEQFQSLDASVERGGGLSG
jgi:hypothetical protein